MDGDVLLEICGYRIAISKAPSKAAAPQAPLVSPLASSSSSFELVDLPPAAGASSSYLSGALPSSPYPLQASGPGSPLDLGETTPVNSSGFCVDLPSASPSPVRVPEYPLQGPPRPKASVTSPPPSASSGFLQHQVPQVPRPAVRSLISSPLRVPEYPLQGQSRPRSEVRESFPPLPGVLLETCRNLRGGSLSWQERALRAWEAGCWARAVLDGAVPTPNSLAQVGLQSRFYCVIAAEGLSDPCVVRSFAAYKAIVGELRRGGSLSHGFPSEAESRLYFAGAGLDFPSA